MPLATVAVSVTTKTKVPLQDTEASHESAFDLLADKHALVPRIADGPPRHFGCCVQYDLGYLKIWPRMACIYASERITAWLINYIHDKHGDDGAEYEQAALELLGNLGRHATAWGAPPRLRPQCKPVVRTRVHNTGAHIVLSTENAYMQLQLDIMSGLCTAIVNKGLDAAPRVQRAIVAGLPRVLGVYTASVAAVEGDGAALADMHFVHRSPDEVLRGERTPAVTLVHLRLPCHYTPAIFKGAPKSFVWVAGKQGVGKRQALIPADFSTDAAAVITYSKDELRESYEHLLPMETLDACIEGDLTPSCVLFCVSLVLTLRVQPCKTVASKAMTCASTAASATTTTSAGLSYGRLPLTGLHTCLRVSLCTKRSRLRRCSRFSSWACGGITPIRAHFL